jgi:hypothetical protein
MFLAWSLLDKICTGVMSNLVDMGPPIVGIVGLV